MSSRVTSFSFFDFNRIPNGVRQLIFGNLDGTSRKWAKLVCRIWKIWVEQSPIPKYHLQHISGPDLECKPLSSKLPPNSRLQVVTSHWLCVRVPDNTSTDVPQVLSVSDFPAKLILNGFGSRYFVDKSRDRLFIPALTADQKRVWIFEPNTVPHFIAIPSRNADKGRIVAIHTLSDNDIILVQRLGPVTWYRKSSSGAFQLFKSFDPFSQGTIIKAFSIGLLLICHLEANTVVLDFSQEELQLEPVPLPGFDKDSQSVVYSDMLFYTDRSHLHACRISKNNELTVQLLWSKPWKDQNLIKVTAAYLALSCDRSIQFFHPLTGEPFLDIHSSERARFSQDFIVRTSKNTIRIKSPKEGYKMTIYAIDEKKTSRKNRIQKALFYKDPTTERYGLLVHTMKGAKENQLLFCHPANS